MLSWFGHVGSGTCRLWNIQVIMVWASVLWAMDALKHERENSLGMCAEANGNSRACA